MNASRIRFGILTVLLLLTLAACGGGGGSSSGGGGGNTQQGGTAIGAAGGTVVGPNGAKVEIPSGALTNDTPILIEQTTAGAPPLPGGSSVSGQMFAFTPHGTTFAVPVTMTLPFNPALVPAGTTAQFFKKERSVLMGTDCQRYVWRGHDDRRSDELLERGRRDSAVGARQHVA